MWVVPDCLSIAMTVKRLLLAFGGVLIAVLLTVWLRQEPGYANFPPSATGPWIAFGDSLTEGYGASEGNNYPALLSHRLEISITNMGQSGDTTAGGLNRLDDLLRLQPQV